MRAGSLDRVITLQRPTTTIGGDGTPVEAWAPIGTLRAQVVQQSTEEFLRTFGASSETAVIFRTRFMAGLHLSDRVLFEGQTLNIVELKEIGRREGLEIRCTATGG